MKRLLLIISVIFALQGLALTQSYYRTPSGERYHKGTCHTVKNVAYKITEQEALNAGLTPCKTCLPEKAAKFEEGENTAQGGGEVTKQCLGMTKKGTRCKHWTKIANGYCFQHKPPQ